jgi:hypothetical protein
MSVSSMIGKVLLLAGAVIAGVGVILLVAGRWLGRGGGLLPGDVFWRRGDVSFYFPLGTCIAASIVLSVLLTLALYIVGHWRH